MCEGTPRSSEGTRKWYESQEDQMTDEEKKRANRPGPWRGKSGWHGPSGWHFGHLSVGARLLLGGHLVRWWRWVFVDLDRHAPGCRWARIAQAVPR